MALGFLRKLKSSLSNTRRGLAEGLRRVVSGGDVSLDDLEERLIEADLGVDMAMRLVGRLSRARDEEAARAVVREELLAAFGEKDRSLAKSTQGPTVVMVVGVNGVGKTTTIAKLAKLLGSGGAKVLLGAADTFRAAAVDQLPIWAARVGVPVVGGAAGADAAAVAFDAASAAKARGVDYLILDTAGRLHTRSNLMQELGKIRRVLGKAVPGAPHETLLVLDANIGQNALSQAETFNREVGLTGLVLTKLDGTAKGGIVVAVEEALDIPVKFVGTGEGLDDLAPFDPGEFVEALVGE